MSEVVEYRPVHEWPSDLFRVGSDGSVWRKLPKGRWKRFVPFNTKKGHPTRSPHWIIQAHVNGILTRRSVALIVTRAFHGPRPLGCQPFRFPDPDPSNNRAENLRWAPRGTSMIGVKSGIESQVRGSKTGTAKLTEDMAIRAREMVSSGFSMREVAERFRVHEQTISDVVRGNTWRHVGGSIDTGSRRVNGSSHGRAKLDEQDVLDILSNLKDMPATEVARMYGVAPDTIGKIRKGVIWKHVTRSIPA